MQCLHVAEVADEFGGETRHALVQRDEIRRAVMLVQPCTEARLQFFSVFAVFGECIDLHVCSFHPRAYMTPIHRAKVHWSRTTIRKDSSVSPNAPSV